jgi:uncharacterized protein (TIGR00369 family)
MQSQEFARFFEEICNFDRYLGMHLTVREPGCIGYRLTVGEQHLSMPGACHGGVLAAMMDGVLGLTALSSVFPEGKLCQTVEFKINYLAAVGPGVTLEGEGRIEFAGSRLMVTTGEIIDSADRRPVAKGMGTFSLYPLDRKRDLLDYLPESVRTLAALDSATTP